MTELQSFTQQLREHIQARGLQIEGSIIGELKENWRSYQTNVEAIYSLLLRKGLLREDPYKKEYHVSDISPPKDLPFGDSYKDDELSIRLGQYCSILDFLNNYSSFTLEGMDLKHVKNLVGLLSFIKFTDFSTNSTRNTTRALAEVIDKIKKGSDQLASGAIQSSLNQLSMIAKKLEKNIKEISQFKREEYKLKVREELISGMDLGNSMPLEIFTREMKKQFQKMHGALPYYPELVEEIHRETFGDESQDLREKLLKAVAVQKKESISQAGTADLKPLLIDALRTLANSTRHIDTALEKMRSNSALIQSRPQSFMDKFKQWIIQMTSGKTEQIIYEIELIDPATSIHSTKALEFEGFMAGAEKKTRMLNGLLAKSSSLLQKLQQASEDQVFSYLDKSSRDIAEINKTLDALDTYFKTEVSRYERDKIRGVKNEVAAVKGHLHNAMQKKHEYVARKEEQDQLRRLGLHHE